MKEVEFQSKQEELELLRRRVGELEAELSGGQESRWRPSGYYTAYYATTGGMLGMLSASTSLLFNVVGATMTGLHPLRLIQVYLTFPMGEKALTLDTGLALTAGCCLYLATGMVLGVPFYLLLTWLTAEKSLGFRVVAASIIAISMWLGHFYLVLAWLQPLLFNGNWIVSEIPPWVAALTHLVFGWTMAWLYPLGLYEPYQLQTEHLEPKAKPN